MILIKFYYIYLIVRMEGPDYRCAKCSERFNSVDRQQLMLPCGDSICLSCFEPLMQPQESKLVCPVDEEVVVIPKKFRDNVNKMLK